MKNTQQATDLCHTFLVKLLHDVLKVQQAQKKTTSQLTKVLYTRESAGRVFYFILIKLI
jgi:hypothetical protein